MPRIIHTKARVRASSGLKRDIEPNAIISPSGRDAARVEGKRGDSWILVDFIDVIVQVFDSESRSFYDFDRLLAEAEQIDIALIEEELDNEN